MKSVLDNSKTKMDKTIAALRSEFALIRTGRANPSLFEKLSVEYYGSETPLNQIASISVPEARLVVIQPWDKSALSSIEKALLKSDLGFNPSNDGNVLRINFPALTEERRKDLAKNAKGICENYKITIRNLRRECIDELKKMEKDSLITEDQLKDGEGKIQKLTDSSISEIDSIFKEKETEIMEI